MVGGIRKWLVILVAVAAGLVLAAVVTVHTPWARSRAKLMDIVRELHGQASGSVEARRMADAVRGAQTRARTLFNAHGGDIGDLADFGLPHAHDTAKVRAAGWPAWRMRSRWIARLCARSSFKGRARPRWQYTGRR